ncbi:leucyl aminopeptidase, partial [Candidatus Parcubacteria bacterium]|nr:leucyl aminopeptidase [Candidatus Parcubacteria bacterium]
MKFEVVDKKINQIKADVEVVLVPSKKLKHKWARDLAALKQLDFKGEDGEIAYLANRKRIYVGIGSLETDDQRIGVATAIRNLKSKKVKSLKIGLYGEDSLSSAKALVEGFILGAYEFDQYKTKKAKNNINRIMISSETYSLVDAQIESVKTAFNEGVIMAEATNYVRDLVNQPPSDLTPPAFAAEAKKLAKENKLAIKVYGKQFLEKQGMGAFLGVNRASAFPPQLIHIIYKPERAKAKIALVGKGITFDTGGLSLKPTKGMTGMKMDMGGAGAIFGVIKSASQLKLPLEIHAIIGATDNVISKEAYKVDDVLRARNKKTIEVKNTDAEGRLVLADCLSFAQSFEPDYIIDMATLTGSCVVGLGYYTIGAMGHNQSLVHDIIHAAKASGEQTAILPFSKHMFKTLKSEVADISNTSSDSQYGGAITAGLFLGEF